MKTYHWIAAGLGLLMFLVSLWQLETADSGLEITQLQEEQVPITLITSGVEDSSARPLVLIGHGLAGSRATMRGFALTLAHAGYNVAMIDFSGHGGNTKPLPEEGDVDTLVTEAEIALRAVQENGFPVNRIAVLGHSMGSGMALDFGMLHPETLATIAVSPVSRTITPQLPKNLLILAEGLNQRFAQNGEQLLDQGGGPGEDFLEGTARKLEIIPGVEHITILFSPAAQQSARQWLDGIFGLQSGAEDYTDRGILWYLLGLAGTLLFCLSLSPLINNLDDQNEEEVTTTIGRRFGALLVGALGATGILHVLSNAGLDLNRLLGLQAGGYLLIWFAVAGALGILLLGRIPGEYGRPAFLGSLMVFVALWIGVGLLGNYVWLPWILVSKRLILWPVAVLLSVPWLMSVAQAVLPTSWWGRAVWWLGYTLVLVGALFLALRLNPELGFLVLILPVFPLVLGLHAISAGPYRWRMSFALGGALFFGWLVVAVFPLQ
ncbi:MAG: alpha/beta hydrolase [Anaerolineales bacterium]|jgi:pimeloyl-ACP methyl ester carboxylesterase